MTLPPMDAETLWVGILVTFYYQCLSSHAEEVVELPKIQQTTGCLLHWPSIGGFEN